MSGGNTASGDAAAQEQAVVSVVAEGHPLHRQPRQRPLAKLVASHPIVAQNVILIGSASARVAQNAQIDIHYVDKFSDGVRGRKAEARSD